MNQILDLSIALTSPPQGSPPEAIASIAFRNDQQGLLHTGDLLTNPLTERERDDLRWYLEDYWKWPYEAFVVRAKQVEVLLSKVGQRLYDMVFGSNEAQMMLQAWRLQPADQRQISIVSDVPKAFSLPWELLHDEQGFLALRTRHPVAIVRRLPIRELAAFPTTYQPPLRILLVTARPKDAPFIDQRSVARELLDEVESQVDSGTIDLEFLRPATLGALRGRLRNYKRPIHVLHFDGHGMFDEIDGQGKLAFENERGELDLVKAEDVAQVLQDSGVRLAVLATPQSAISAEEDVYSSLAAQLIRGGVDAVVAMGASFLLVSTILFVEKFYRELTMGTPLPIAHERAQQALYDNPRRHIMRRRRDEEGKTVELRDWWVPHFYQRSSFILQPTKAVYNKHKSRQTNTHLRRLSKRMPGEPRYGFRGRSRELFQVERSLLQGKLVVISGFSGLGKTSLTREAADWLTRTGMYTGACFVSFEQGGNSVTLLKELGDYFGIHRDQYNPNDSAAALALLSPILKKQRLLIIVDNIESILPGGTALIDSPTRTLLWDVLLELAQMVAGVLLISRHTAFGDGRLASGNRVVHLELKGLQPEDAYELANRVLDDLGIDRVRASYVQLRDLLAQLDHHPLAIQLLLPALRELSFDKINADFEALLPSFIDDKKMGLNRSLLASLSYWMQRLDEQQQKWLLRLAIFECSATEENLLKITDIPETEWSLLRPLLEQAGLLVAERIHQISPVSFLHFHPVLSLFLRRLPNVENPVLIEHYITFYRDLVFTLYQADQQEASSVCDSMRPELSNVRHALELSQAKGYPEVALQIAQSIVSFLNTTGLESELGELPWVTKVEGSSTPLASKEQTRLEKDDAPLATSNRGKHKEETTKNDVTSDIEEAKRGDLYMPDISLSEMPSFGKTFLEPPERKRVITIVEEVIENMSTLARKNLLVNSRVPKNLIGLIPFSDNLPTGNVATNIVMTLEGKGTLDSDTHILGSFLNQVIAESAGYDARAYLVAIIFRYNLLKNREHIRELSSRFQLPSPTLKAEAYRQLTLAPLPERLRPSNPIERLESLRRDGIRRYLNVNFLIAGARAVCSVCKVEFDGTGEGTGFLVAPDLVLTNYHVLIPSWYNRAIEERIKTCAMRFGAITDEEGGVRAGTLFRLSDELPLAFSKSQELDYVLLRLQKRVSAGGPVSPVSLVPRRIQEREHVNVIHHPNNGPMEVSLRDNEVVTVEGRHVYYLADTEEGSSGSPVFDDNWKVVALHRAGREKDAEGNIVVDANAGIPISLIFNEIKSYLPKFGPN